jgi:phage-related protein
MSNLTYNSFVSNQDKDRVWLEEKTHTPPFSRQARIEAGVLLRRLQKGESLSLPHSRPMPSIAKNCHELRIQDKTVTWRIIYKTDIDAIIILDIFAKKTSQTSLMVIQRGKERLRHYELSRKEISRQERKTNGKQKKKKS